MSTCRVCGCTDERACSGGCHWIEPDLCSSCATLTVKSSIIIYSDDEGSIQSREEIKVIGEEFYNLSEAIAFIYGYVEGSSNLSDYDVIIPGKKYKELSIHYGNDDPIEGYTFEITGD